MADCDAAEKLLHAAFSENRPNPRREFFTIKPESAKSALMLAALEDVTPDTEDLIPDIVERSAVESIALRRRNTSLRDINISAGEELQLCKDPTIICEVVDDFNVRFEGEVMSLSKSALRALNSIGYDKTRANGWNQWVHEGRSLNAWLNDYLAV